MSDASGTLWLNVKKRKWSDSLLSLTELTENNMPQLSEGSEATETIKNWADPISSVGQEFGENISVKLEELAETLKTVSQPLSNTRQDMVDNISVRVNELSNSLKELTDPVAASSKDIVTGVSTRINELTKILNGVLADSNRKTSIKQ